MNWLLCAVVFVFVCVCVRVGALNNGILKLLFIHSTSIVLNIKCFNNHKRWVTCYVQNCFVVKCGISHSSIFI